MASVRTRQRRIRRRVEDLMDDSENAIEGMDFSDHETNVNSCNVGLNLSYDNDDSFKSYDDQSDSDYYPYSSEFFVSRNFHAVLFLLDKYQFHANVSFFHLS